MQDIYIGFNEALQLTLKNINQLPSENVSLADCTGRVASSGLYALVDSPSVNTSLKNGYAVLSREIANATKKNPVKLVLTDPANPEKQNDLRVIPGTALRVLTGDPVPENADAVVAEEFAKKEGNILHVETFAEPGRNILSRGSDAAIGSLIHRAGVPVSPVTAGLLAAAGHNTIPVFKNPAIGLLTIGNNIIEPGTPAGGSMLYASNNITLAGLCGRFNMKTSMAIAKDDHDSIFNALQTMPDKTDVLITSGGALTEGHDIAEQVLNELGWEKIYHGIRMGPGKAAGFGILGSKPVFILPGAPPSNLIAFLQIALPGLLALSGYTNPGLPKISARLTDEIRGCDPEWTDFFYGTLKYNEDFPEFSPLSQRCRLSSMAESNAVASVPEGLDHISRGSLISVQLLGHMIPENR